MSWSIAQQILSHLPGLAALSPEFETRSEGVLPETLLESLAVDLPAGIAVVAVLAALVSFGAHLKGRRPLLWFVYAALLLPLAGLHILVVGWLKSCPHCSSRVPLEADTCPECTWPFAEQPQ